MVHVYDDGPAEDTKNDTEDALEVAQGIERPKVYTLLCSTSPFVTKDFRLRKWPKAAKSRFVGRVSCVQYAVCNRRITHFVSQSKAELWQLASQCQALDRLETVPTLELDRSASEDCQLDVVASTLKRLWLSNHKPQQGSRLLYTSALVYALQFLEC